MISLLAVMAIMAAMVAVMAVPAFAQSRSEGAPNCERGQFTAFFQKASNKSDNDNPFKNLFKGFDCLS